AKDKRVQDELWTYIDSHIICHSDTEGYFVPIDFEYPLIDRRKKNGLPGGILGSCQRAFRGLVRTAPILGVKLRNERLSDRGARVIVEEADGSHPYWIERKAWLSHFEAFRYSLEHKCAVVYG